MGEIWIGLFYKQSFKVGDWVNISHEPNAAWIGLLGANKLSAMGKYKVDWTPYAFRLIKSVRF